MVTRLNFIPSIEKEVNVIKLLDGIDEDRSKSRETKLLEELYGQVMKTAEENQITRTGWRVIIGLWILVTLLCLGGVFYFFPENSIEYNVALGLIGGMVIELLLYGIPAIGKWAGKK